MGKDKRKDGNTRGELHILHSIPTPSETWEMNVMENELIDSNECVYEVRWGEGLLEAINLLACIRNTC